MNHTVNLGDTSPFRKHIQLDEHNRNAPRVKEIGYEVTGLALVQYAAEALGRSNLADADILDVGCGVRLTQALINCEVPIKSYTGIEIQEPIIAYLKEMVSDERFDYHFWDVPSTGYRKEGSLTRSVDLPMSRKFDIIWLFSVFTHLDPSDASAMLSILRRHVQPNGAMIFSCFLDDSVPGFADKSEARGVTTPLHIATYSEATMRNLIEENGWKVRSVNPPKPYIQHYFVCDPA